MSTTTDASITESPGSGAALLLRAGKLAAAAFAVVFAWFVAVGVLTYFTEISPTVIVFGPQATTMGAMSRSDTRVLEAGPGFIVVQGSGRGFVRKLYAEGAWLVMPSNLDGCGLGSYLREKFGRAKA
ncbi:MAG: hypothetical protein ACXWJH_01455 [Hyphomicrobium sp.]